MVFVSLLDKNTKANVIGPILPIIIDKELIILPKIESLVLTPIVNPRLQNDETIVNIVGRNSKPSEISSIKVAVAIQDILNTKITSTF